MDFLALVGRVCAGEDLSADEMAFATRQIITQPPEPGQVGTFLIALREKGETVAEVVGAARALRACMTAVRCARPDLVDTCGTGGDGSSTFNISTAAALVAAAAGVAVAKHGNRSVTSKTGSADVLEALGIKLEVPAATVERCLDELGFGFCFAPLLHPALKTVGAVRKALGVPTIFNLLGPLANPAGAPYQVLGVGSKARHELLARAVAELGTQRTFVVHGGDGLDEVTLRGPTEVFISTPAGLSQEVWTPAAFGFPVRTMEQTTVQNPQESAAMVWKVLEGTPGEAREVVLINAAAALLVCGKVTDRAAGVALAAEAIDSGNARRLVQKLVEYTHAA